MIAFADIGDHCHAAAIETQALAQQATARGLQDRGIDVRMRQHAARAARPTAIAGINALIGDVHPVGGGHADAQAATCQQMRNEADGGGFTIRPRNGDDWNAPVFARTEQGGDDRFADRPAFAEGRR